MAQRHDEHLTIEQLSASLDKQLSSQERAVYDAHMSTCQRCRSNLADIRLTVAMLHALPEEEAPRSFVLPVSIAIVPEQSIRQDATPTPLPQRQRPRLSPFRRSIRVVSTLAAVLAFFFITSGLLSFVHLAGASSATSSSSNSSAGVAGTAHSPATTPGDQVTANAHSQGVSNTKPTPAPTHALNPTGTATTNFNSDHQTNQGPTIPPLIDPGQPAGRLGIGIILLALGITGLIITRRRRVATY